MALYRLHKYLKMHKNIDFRSFWRDTFTGVYIWPKKSDMVVCTKFGHAQSSDVYNYALNIVCSCCRRATKKNKSKKIRSPRDI